LSCTEIGAELGYHAASIRHRLREHGLDPRRTAPRDRKWGVKLYVLWKAIRARGLARDVDFCPEWKRFEGFYAWALSSGYRPGLRFRREVMARGFVPSNCGWRAPLRRRRRAVEPKPDAGMRTERERIKAIWRGVRRHCRDPRDPAYAHYGAKGARLCREWNEFEPFFEWALNAGSKPGLCLVRKGRARVFSPANCTWVTRLEVSRNAHHPSSKLPPRWTVTAFGEKKGPTEWARDRRCPVSVTTLCRRLRSGWNTESALTAPPQNRGWTGLARRSVRAFGRVQSVAEWSRDPRCSVGGLAIIKRLDRGIDPETAITAPPFRCPEPPQRSARRARRKT